MSLGQPALGFQQYAGKAVYRAAILGSFGSNRLKSVESLSGSPGLALFKTDGDEDFQRMQEDRIVRPAVLVERANSAFGENLCFSQPTLTEQDRR